MKSRIIFAATVLSGLVFAGQNARAQAHVNEIESATLYVDATSGSDSAAGTVTSPLKTISAAASKALQNNYKGIGTKVLINPGTYRETVTVSAGSRLTSAAMTFQALQTGTAVIAGSDVLSSPYQSSANSSIYTYTWTYSTATCPAPSGWPTNLPPIGYRREVIFINGAPVTEVMSQSDMRPNTFYLNTGTKQLLVWPAAGTNMSTALVEVAARPTTLMLNHLQNTVVRGLAMKHANTCVNQNGAQVYSSQNVLIDSVQASDNNWGGLGVSSSTNVTVQNSVASRNGGIGFSGNRDTNILFQFDEADYNGWRSAQAGLYDFASGGLKLMLMRSATVSQYFAYRNQAQGLWFDTDNKNITIDGATLIGNTKTNLQLEANQGPIALQNSLLCSGDVGVNILTSGGITITGNRFFNNGGGQYQAAIYLAGKGGGRTIVDHLTGQSVLTLTTHTTITNNVVEDAASGQYVFSTYLSGSDWNNYASTLHSNNNQWFDFIQQTAFTMPASKHVTLGGWSASTGQDTASTWVSVPTVQNACVVPSSSSSQDFNVEETWVTFKTYTLSSGKVAIGMRVKSFSGAAVNLSTGQLPSGVSASLSSPSSTGGNFTLTVSASSSAAKKVVPITVFAQSGNLIHSVTLLVSI